MSQALRYTVRRVNPFLGIVRVLETAEGRALSTDGVNWELQVLAERPVGWGSLNLGRTETLYYRYGVWSAADGQASYPVHPTLDRRRLHRAAEALVAVVAEDGGCGQWPCADRHECWLLDGAQRRPVALLATVQKAELIPAHPPVRWKAAPAGEPGFPSAEFEALEVQVSRRAGSASQAQWFERRADGSGAGLVRHATTVERELPPEGFPELLLAEAWPDATEAARASAYLGWLAPRLLTLPLASATRARVEMAAARQPELVDHFFPVYPAVADTERMNALRVQARIMRANAATGSGG